MGWVGVISSREDAAPNLCAVVIPNGGTDGECDSEGPPSTKFGSQRSGVKGRVARNPVRLGVYPKRVVRAAVLGLLPLFGNNAEGHIDTVLDVVAATSDPHLGGLSRWQGGTGD